jgi:diguanylate cyclase (GGDEF)-like protein
MQSLAQITKQAEEGDADAQFLLGAFYDEGFGVAQNYRESIRWFRKAAAQGHAAAQCSIGVNYTAGHGVSKNYAKARAWFREAADRNHAKAQFNLGLMALKGLGAQRNCSEAAIWFRKAAEQGHVEAQTLLGGLYMKGTGVAKDYTEASRWLQKACDQGHADAEIIVKLLYAGNDGYVSGIRQQSTTFSIVTDGDAATDNHREDECELLADRDSLTGILNRRALMRAIHAEIDRVRATKGLAAHVVGPCVFFIGLDEFAKANDETGPAKLDAVLCGLADRLAETLRRSDSLGRMGGAELAVFMPSVRLSNAAALTERLRQAAAAATFETPSGPLRASISIGVAAFQQGDSALTLLERAEKAMCAARRAGNCVDTGQPSITQDGLPNR